MKTLNIIHLGPGKVGTEFQNQLKSVSSAIKKNLGISIVVKSTFSSKNTSDEITRKISSIALPAVLVDTTASEQTYPYIYTMLKKGGYAVLSNKKPISGSQGRFNKIYRFHNRDQRLLIETAVGAGLPIISTLRELMATGDEILKLEGCFSGTLGYIFSQIETGVSYSNAVKNAKQLGLTEPDPRDDLNCMDVARKALILYRIIGGSASIDHVRRPSLYQNKLDDVGISDFLKGLKKGDVYWQKRINSANRAKKVIRVVATVQNRSVLVQLKDVDKNSEIGSLSGPDNIIVITTRRYKKHPLVVKGPGAGVAVTAAGVLGDVIKIVKEV